MKLPFHLPFKLGLVVVVEGESGVDLGERKVRVLFVNGIGAPAVSDVVEHDLDHFDVGLVDPSRTSVISHDVGSRFRSDHGHNVPATCRSCNFTYDDSHRMGERSPFALVWWGAGQICEKFAFAPFFDLNYD